MEGKIRGFFHAYVGQEAIAAGCMTATRPEDLLLPPIVTTVLPLQRVCLLIHVWPSCMARQPEMQRKGRKHALFGKSVNFYGGHGIVGAADRCRCGSCICQNNIVTPIMWCFVFEGWLQPGKASFMRHFNLAML